MQSKTYSFSTFFEHTSSGIEKAISEINNQNKPILVLCIGSDLIVGDSLGPLIGTMLTKKNIPAFVYGSLSNPITAKEINYAKNYLTTIHPKSMIIAVDAAVGDSDDVGTIRVLEKGIKPGLGVNKNLKSIGDCSIIGIVAPKQKENYSLYNLTRLGFVYKMAEQIANGIEKYLLSKEKSA